MPHYVRSKRKTFNRLNLVGLANNECTSFPYTFHLTKHVADCVTVWESESFWEYDTITSNNKCKPDPLYSIYIFHPTERRSEAERKSRKRKTFQISAVFNCKEDELNNVISNMNSHKNRQFSSIQYSALGKYYSWKMRKKPQKSRTESNKKTRSIKWIAANGCRIYSLFH